MDKKDMIVCPCLLVFINGSKFKGLVQNSLQFYNLEQGSMVLCVNNATIIPQMLVGRHLVILDDICIIK